MAIYRFFNMAAKIILFSHGTTALRPIAACGVLFRIILPDNRLHCFCINICRIRIKRSFTYQILHFCILHFLPCSLIPRFNVLLFRSCILSASCAAAVAVVVPGSLQRDRQWKDMTRLYVNGERSNDVRKYEQTAGKYDGEN